MPPSPRAAALAAAAAALLAAPVLAAAQGVPAGSRDRPWPDGVAALTAPCHADSVSTRIWWSDTPGADGAVEGADGSCASIPPVVSELMQVGDAAAARLPALGFAPLVGEAPPRFIRIRGLAAQLLRSRPASRAAQLRRVQRSVRGSFLAGLTAGQRTRILRGLPKPLATRLRAEVATARRGTPTGGDRRADAVVDASGITQLVRTGQPGVSPCSLRVSGGRGVFSEASVVVLAPPGSPAPRSSLAHELFHVEQCGMSVGGAASALLREGTAEWFASLAEPASFAGAVRPEGGGITITGGNARTATFCNRFDPEGTGLLPYASWGVWQALDGGGTASAGAVRALLAAMAGRVGVAEASGTSTVAAIGAARWSAALASAVQAQCGSLRSPSGETSFAAEVRGFIGGDESAARDGAPVTLTIPPGGADSVQAVAAGVPVQIAVSSPQVAAATLLPGVAIGAGGSVLTRTAVGTSILASVPPALVTEDISVSVANPRTDAAVQVRVEVVGP